MSQLRGYISDVSQRRVNQVMIIMIVVMIVTMFMIAYDGYNGDYDYDGGDD